MKTEKEGKDGKGMRDKAGRKSGSWAVALEKRRFGKQVLRTQKQEKTTEKLVLGYDDDSRFSAISSILVTEFQLRPVPGVFRIL